MEYPIVNTTRLFLGIIFGIWIAVLAIITLNTSLSIVDKDGCFRYGIVTANKKYCNRINSAYTKVVFERCPIKTKILVTKEGVCSENFLKFYKFLYIFIFIIIN